MNRPVVFALMLVARGPIDGYAQSADSTRSRPPIITVKEAVGIGVASVVAAAFDTKVRDLFQSDRSSTTDQVARLGNSFGSGWTVGPALVGLWVVGKVVDRPAASDAAVWAAASGAVAGAITLGLKGAFGRARPPGGDAFDFRPLSGAAAFPSGHTSFAFAIASSLAHSTKDRWSDALFYSAATLTGLSRINDDRHWFSDVVGGAAIGILTGRQLRHHSKTIRPVVGAGTVGVAATF